MPRLHIGQDDATHVKDVRRPMPAAGSHSAGLSVVLSEGERTQQERLALATLTCRQQKASLQEIADSSCYQNEADQKALKEHSEQLKASFKAEIEAQASPRDLDEIATRLEDERACELLTSDLKELQDAIAQRRKEVTSEGFFALAKELAPKASIATDTPEFENVANTLARAVDYDKEFLEKVAGLKPDFFASYYSSFGELKPALAFTDELVFELNAHLQSLNEEDKADFAAGLKAVCLSLSPDDNPRALDRIAARADFALGLMFLQEAIEDYGIDVLRVRSAADLKALDAVTMIHVDNQLIARSENFRRLDKAAGLTVIGLSYKAYQAMMDGAPARAQDCQNFIGMHQNSEALTKHMGGNNLDLVRNRAQAMMLSAALWKTRHIAGRDRYLEAVRQSDPNREARESIRMEVDALTCV